METKDGNKYAYIAAIAECDENGELYTSIISGGEDKVLDGINGFFKQEADDGHKVRGADFDTISEADGFDSFDMDGVNHYRVTITTIMYCKKHGTGGTSVPVPDGTDIVIDTIRNWTNDSCAYLSESTEYARGYRTGILRAKELVGDMLRCMENGSGNLTEKN